MRILEDPGSHIFDRKSLTNTFLSIYNSKIYKLTMHEDIHRLNMMHEV